MEDYRDKLLTRGDRTWLEPPCVFCGESVIPTADRNQAPQFLDVPGKWAHSICYGRQRSSEGLVARPVAVQEGFDFNTEAPEAEQASMALEAIA